MKTVMTFLTILLMYPLSAIAEIGTREGGGMMNGGWWWRMNSQRFLMVITAFLIIFGIFLILKRGR